MVDTPLATNGSRPLPAYIRIDGSPRFSANQLRAIKAETGLALEQIMNDGAAVIQALAWRELRRAGYSVSWDEAGDIEVEVVDLAAPPDPTSTDIVTPSPHSVGSGE